MLGETDTFTLGQTLYVVFTVDTQDMDAQVLLKLYLLDLLEDVSATLTPTPGAFAYSVQITLNGLGVHKIEVDYDGTPEASITFNVVEGV